jgi:Mg2+-importing ATPase
MRRPIGCPSAVGGSENICCSGSSRVSDNRQGPPKVNGPFVLEPDLGCTDPGAWQQPAGLSTDQANRRLSVYGPNDAAATKRRPAWRRFLALFANPLVGILLFASALSAAPGDTASFVIVVTIVVLSVVMDFVQEMRAQNAVDALQAKVALHARAVRDGREVIVLVAALVPGDVVKLRAGDLVPADGRLLAARDFFVNEALLTGESYPVEKNFVEEPKPAATVTTARERL